MSLLMRLFFGGCLILVVVRFYYDIKLEKKHVIEYMRGKLQRMADGERDDAPWVMGGVKVQ